MTKKISIPSMYAIAGSIQPSVFYIYEGKKNESQYIKKPSYIKRESVRGVQAAIGSTEKNIIDPNIQTIERAYIHQENNSIFIKGHIKFLSNSLTPLNCNSQEFISAHEDFIKKSKSENLFETLANYYLMNILNGRWLWRNYNISNNIEIKISTDEDKTKHLTFNPDKLKNLFDLEDENLLKNPDFLFFRNRILESLSTKRDLFVIDIEAWCEISNGGSFYPSEEMVTDKDNKKSDAPSKVLFGVIDSSGSKQAAIHSQKIGNAIRTIDVWYADYKTNGYPIPVEPYGQQQNIFKAWRGRGNKDLYTILKNIDKLTLEDNIEDKYFLLACMIRGGVFSGEKDKKSSDGDSNE